MLENTEIWAENKKGKQLREFQLNEFICWARALGNPYTGHSYTLEIGANTAIPFDNITTIHHSSIKV